MQSKVKSFTDFATVFPHLLVCVNHQLEMWLSRQHRFIVKLDFQGHPYFVVSILTSKLEEN